MHTIILVALTLCVVINAICFVVLRRLQPEPPMLRNARLAGMGLAALVGSASAAQLLFHVA